MPSPTKIAMVGGGSYAWCPRLISDLLHEPTLAGSEIVLLDPNLTAAKEVAAAAAAMAASRQYDITFVPTSDEATAFTDAEFVIITISTGDLEMMAHDLAVPERYGIYQTVGDTVGPGGWSRALRNVPVFVHLSRQIEKYSPRALVLNYTNPLAVLTSVMCQVSNLRVVGLCHGVFATYRMLQQLFAVTEADLALSFGGVNHFFWVTDFTVKGEPGYPLLRDRLAGRSFDEVLAAGDRDEIGFHSHHALFNELYHAYGYLTYCADRHTCEFLPGYLTPTAAALDRFKLVRTHIEARFANRDRARERTHKLARGEAEPFPRSRETAVDIIKAAKSGTPFVDVMNLPNHGQIDNLPRQAVVETLGMVDGLGFRPLTMGALPPVLQTMVAPHCEVQLLTTAAAMSGDREGALQALMRDPLCAHLTPGEIREMGLALIAATREWLPQFSS